jgi:hypothetical protein
MLSPQPRGGQAGLDDDWIDDPAYRPWAEACFQPSKFVRPAW